ncbi:LGFP repeat-containing protein [Microbacterium sp. HMH0099]|uniref:LGFP repeat-containing protein n=1 Tax=Microbacterium sp. HMH0099 TaxID=3414026 RepID=UPI003BF6BD45
MASVIVAAWAVTVSLLTGTTPARAIAPVEAPATAAAAAVAPVAAAAAAPSGFNASQIITNDAFFASGTMTEAQIQSFLESKVPVCQSGYTCLKDWYDTSRTTSADAMCGAYSGGTRERAARIIFKVAQACGINPQVILTTLQKEQGLVTHTWPSDWRYRIAMGQGCPDTAACDTRYYGFFNQVYGAAWQFKRYANPPGTSQYFTWYAPGKTWNIRYNPSESCGSSPVAVANQATSNLYYYTPYQPNAAALRAGYGEGDGCSAYGNRNFFNYFTDWFGSTTYPVGGAVVDRWNELGGRTGTLGLPTGPFTCGTKDGGCFQNFQLGAISWTPGTGAWETYGQIRARWAALGYETGVLGYPVAAPVCGTKDGGCYQEFQLGAISWTSATGAWETYGAIRTAWQNAGYEGGALGYPTAAPVNADGRASQTFQGGAIGWSSTAGAFPVTGEVGKRWVALSAAAGVLGAPVGPYTCGTKDNGCYQNFQQGAISWSKATGAWESYGQIRARWSAIGFESGVLGYPVAAPVCGTKDGGCFQNFQLGAISWSSATGAWETYGAIRGAWQNAGFEGGALGYPTAAPVNADGRASQTFQGGGIGWSSTAGAFPVTGEVGKRWVALSAASGVLGAPVGPYTCGTKDNGCYQNFQQGAISWSAATGAWETYGAIRTYWRQNGYEAGTLGYPVGAVTAQTAGQTQRFQTGTATWDRATNTVSFARTP